MSEQRWADQVRALTVERDSWRTAAVRAADETIPNLKARLADLEAKWADLWNDGDWRARAARAERRLVEVEAENERLRIEVERLHGRRHVAQTSGPTTLGG